MNDGGPVHPSRGFVVDASGALCGETVQHAGMTLRQQYAGQNVAAMVSTIRSEDDYERFRCLAGQFSVSQWIASEAVKQADALLAALEVAGEQA